MILLGDIFHNNLSVQTSWNNNNRSVKNVRFETEWTVEGEEWELCRWEGGKSMKMFMTFLFQV